ncbi:MAG: TetR/AcrR family transcriptional regulator [Actinobacteria bacterium]|nr:MAG: TetR/AcrR family transcriptional regulator [Actinomycetota bacterium]
MKPHHATSTETRSDPVARRAPAKRTTANTAAILKALTQEATAVGLDGIAASSIARRAGLTTGAIYSRFENNDEMLIALWEVNIRERFSQHIAETIEYIIGQDEGGISPELISRIERPPAVLGLGAEFLVVAQRNEVVGEVVVPQFSKWLRDAGLNKNATPIECAGAALGASIAIGSILRSFITSSNPNMGPVLRGLRNAYKGARPTTSSLSVISLPQIAANTGNEVRDALINATSEVMSRTGFTNATISRIARKSGITSGSIYNVYVDKEELMNDAVSNLLKSTQTQNLTAKQDASSEHHPNFGLTESFQFGLLTERRTWLRFRQECTIATRHHRTTHREMRKVVTDLDKRMIAAFPEINPDIINLLSAGEQAIGYGYSTLFAFSDQLSRCDFNAIMLQIAKQNKLG